MKTSIIFAVVLGLSVAVQAQEKVPIKLDYPKPPWGGNNSYNNNPPAIRDYKNLDPYPYDMPRPPILVSVGCDTLLSRGCKVTSSEDDDGGPVIGKLEYITDGVKEHDIDAYVEMGPGLQWIQIDLGSEKEIHAVCIWHYYYSQNLWVRNGRVYRDVIVQISNDANFKEGVVTVFNNDHDNSAGLGKGNDMEYIESNYGRPFAVDAIKGRYVRCYSRGNNENGMNHYTEVEVFGRDIAGKQQEMITP